MTMVEATCSTRVILSEGPSPMRAGSKGRIGYHVFKVLNQWLTSHSCFIDPVPVYVAKSA